MCNLVRGEKSQQKYKQNRSRNEIYIARVTMPLVAMSELGRMSDHNGRQRSAAKLQM